MVCYFIDVNFEPVFQLATFGPESAISETRNSLMTEMDNSWARYKDANENRNPFKNFQVYILPLSVACK